MFQLERRSFGGARGLRRQPHRRSLARLLLPVFSSAPCAPGSSRRLHFPVVAPSLTQEAAISNFQIQVVSREIKSEVFLGSACEERKSVRFICFSLFPTS